ncbi:hypothetical protein [Streptomyces sp. NWU339]|uniref:hypothetical protein n=1 Tax=Streptomyces sp. NWU339 TaxID=2185284 RepID=UPI0026A2F85B|nr:hypothetical protein [Streptomyces sp. NWU339]
MSSALFVALVLPVLAGAHSYVWWRMVRATTYPGSWWRRVGTVLIVLLVAAPPGERALPASLATAVGWPGFTWMAGILYLTLALLAGEAVRPVLMRVRRRSSVGDTASPALRTASDDGGERPYGTGSVPGPDSPAPASADELLASRRMFVSRGRRRRRRDRPASGTSSCPWPGSARRPTVSGSR